jgi:flagellar biosynthetic protein FliR
MVRQGTSAMGHGLALAAPLVLAALVANVGLAVMNRAAPAVNVFAISLAVVLLAGGSVLLAGSGSMVAGIAGHAHEAVSVFVR